MSIDKTIDFDDRTTQKIVEFILSIGIDVEIEKIDEDTFLPGILIKSGAIYIDKEKLKYPGDLLHEAGHLATLTPKKRASVYNDVSKNPGDEIVTLAWSYAAAYYLEIEPNVVFHDGGYKGEAKWLAEHYSSGGDMGVPLLDWMELSTVNHRAKDGDMVFPYMKKWLREDLT